jgi:hydrogenase maturation factor
MKHLVRHYVQMVLVMFAGMAVLGTAIGLAFETGRGSLMLLEMGFTMTAPMVAWMRWRGHRWQPTLEMAGSMIVPTLAAVTLLNADVVTDIDALLGVEHVAMLAGMLVVMLARREEYSQHAHVRVAA